MTSFVISDTHFTHQNILKFTDSDGNRIREFDSVEEMNETMVDRWNSVVKQGDKVYHLGDVLFGSKDVFKSLWPRLNGSKNLIVGNHDDIKFLSSGGFFKKVYFWRILKEHGLILSHIPLREDQFRGHQHFRESGEGMLNVHGHIHQKPSPEGPYKCVCVEQTNYTPVALEELR